MKARGYRAEKVIALKTTTVGDNGGRKAHHVSFPNWYLHGFTITVKDIIDTKRDHLVGT